MKLVLTLIISSLFLIENVVTESQCSNRVHKWCGLRGECHFSQCVNTNAKEPSK